MERVLNHAVTGLLTLGLAFLAASAVFPGCDDDPQREPEETPTPTPTPSPTPFQLNEEFRTTGFAIASDGEGCDFTGDGYVDNNLPAAFDVFYEALFEVILEVCAAIPIYDDPEECLAEIEQLLIDMNLVVDEEIINELIASGIENGTLLYLEHLSGPVDEATFAWYSGYVNASDEYVTESSLGSQPGIVDLETGGADFGPGNFYFTITDDLKLMLQEAYATFVWAQAMEPSRISQGTLCGGVTESEMRRFAERLIPEALDAYEDQIIDAVLDKIEEEGLFDITVEGEQAFSCGFTFEAVGEDILNIE